VHFWGCSAGKYFQRLVVGFSLVFAVKWPDEPNPDSRCGSCVMQVC
jgi:hypothetical protein